MPPPEPKPAVSMADAGHGDGALFILMDAIRQARRKRKEMMEEQEDAAEGN